MEDRYKELFNDPNLGNEDWLEPGPELLSSIKAELYPEKKDRKYLIIYFLLGVITILLISLFISTQQNNSIGELNNNNESNSLSQESSEEILSINETNKIEIESAQTTKNNSENSSISIEKNQASDSPLSFSSKAKTKNVTYTKDDFSISSSDVPVLSSSLKRMKDNSKSLIDNSIIENNLLSSSKITPQKSNQLIDFVPFISTINAGELDFNTEKIIISKSYDDFVQVKNTKTKAWGLEIGAGYFTSEFILNSNYLAALNPADYSQEPGNGQYVDLRIYKELNSRLSVNIGSTFGRTVFNSGHNSPVVYNLLNEDGNQSIIYDMPMATPLGFISSEIVIQRAADSVEEETELIIDLQNKHSLNILDFTAGVNYKLIDRNRINLSVLSGYGVSYLLDIKNEFRSFTPSAVGFNSGDSKIVSNQENINNITPVLDLGLDLNYEIRKGASVGLSYKFKTNLRPVFELDDFNSTLNRNHYGINFKLDLN